MPAPRRVTAAVEPDPEDQAPELDPEVELEEDSQGSSTASSAATDFFEDTGPEFEGKQDVDPERAAFTIRPGTQELLDVTWDPVVVRSILEAIGQTAHTVAGKGEQDWIFIERELKAISGPLARILSRYDATAAGAAAGDEIAVILGLSGYTLRSVKERKEAMAAAAGAALNPNVAAAPRGLADMDAPQPGYEQAAA